MGRMTRRRMLLCVTVPALGLYTFAVFVGSFGYHHAVLPPLANIQQYIYSQDVSLQDNTSFFQSSKNESTGARISDVKIESSYQGVDMNSYEKALSTHSSPNKWIVLALADLGCVDMAVNFYETSLQRYNVENYLIIASDKQTCTILHQYKIHCYTYLEDKDAAKASVYHSKDFLRKMNIRTFMILDALRLGYHVHHTDLDIFYMKNPYEEFSYENDTYDLAPLIDGRQNNKNAGFIFIRATKPSIAVYEASCKIAQTEPKTDDQRALNRAIESVQNSGSLRLYALSERQYQCGKRYWDESQRNFIEDKECTSCVVVHNNWIVSMEAKRYRFREIGMWQADMDGYYSNPDAKYLTFDNELTQAKREEDIQALKNALAIGIILNRTVILPRFHCADKRCTILDILQLRSFEKYFQYRENSFLLHPKVPDRVKHSVSDIMIISSDKYVNTNSRHQKYKVKVYQPSNRFKGANSNEILKWFGSEPHSVLRFGNLLGSFSHFMDSYQEKSFLNSLKLGFISGSYKQA